VNEIVEAVDMCFNIVEDRNKILDEDDVNLISHEYSERYELSISND
jgi:hypothetical protein